VQCVSFVNSGAKKYSYILFYSFNATFDWPASGSRPWGWRGTDVEQCSPSQRPASPTSNSPPRRALLCRPSSALLLQSTRPSACTAPTAPDSKTTQQSDPLIHLIHAPIRVSHGLVIYIFIITIVLTIHATKNKTITTTTTAAATPKKNTKIRMIIIHNTRMKFKATCQSLLRSSEWQLVSTGCPLTWRPSCKAVSFWMLNNMKMFFTWHFRSINRHRHEKIGTQ